MATRELTIILDVDGTLVDSSYHHALAWGRAFAACGLDIPMWQIHRAIGMGGDKLVPYLCGDAVDRRIGDTLRERWSDGYQELLREVTALPGAQAFVESLRRQGHHVAIASSGSRHDTDEALDIAGVRQLVEGITTGDDIDASKPEPDVLERAWETAGRGAAAVVGDSIYDVQAAQKLGLPCITVRTGGFGAAELSEAGAVLVVDDLTALIDQHWSELASS